MRLANLDRIAAMNSHYRYYTLEDFFNAIQFLGITHAELWTCASHFLLDEFTRQDTGELRQKARNHGIEIVCLTPEQNNPKPYNLAARDPELIQRTKHYFQNAIYAAEELECGLISVSSGWNFYSEPREEGWKRSVTMIYELSEVAYQHGVTLVMETLLPRETRLVRTIRELKKMLDDVNSPGLKVNLDLGSMSVAGESIQQWFDMFGSDIRHCHFVDGHPAGHLAWGEGNRDPEADLSAFYNNNYKGYFTLELLSPDYYEKPWEADKKSLQTLAPWL